MLNVERLRNLVAMGNSMSDMSSKLNISMEELNKALQSNGLYDTYHKYNKIKSVIVGNIANKVVTNVNNLANEYSVPAYSIQNLMKLIDNKKFGVRGHSVWTPDEEFSLKDLRKNGVPIATIAKKLGKTVAAISSKIKKINRTNKTMSTTLQDQMKAYEMYAEGLTLEHIKKVTGITEFVGKLKAQDKFEQYVKKYIEENGSIMGLYNIEHIDKERLRPFMPSTKKDIVFFKPNENIRRNKRGRIMWTEVLENQLIELRAKGLNAYQIADKLGYTYGTVSKKFAQMARKGIALPPANLSRKEVVNQPIKEEITVKQSILEEPSSPVILKEASQAQVKEDVTSTVTTINNEESVLINLFKEALKSKTTTIFVLNNV